MAQRKLTPMGKIIKLRLVELEMTQEALAAQVGTSPQYINHIMYGERTGEKYMDEICKVLDI
ncbi:MAG: helix-turn-helix domain-containing protein [Lachnospiraceae bacterium]|nr:helix-turn-helix domain-containing protein [Lachnospiraceae bacterium]